MKIRRGLAMRCDEAESSTRCSRRSSQRVSVGTLIVEMKTKFAKFAITGRELTQVGTQVG